MKFLRVASAKLSDYLVGEIKKRGEYFDESQISTQEMEKAKNECEIIVASGAGKVEGSLIESMPRLKLIASYGVGFDGIDLEACKRRGVLVANTPDVLNDDVADTAIALYLNCIRNFVNLNRYVKEGMWGKHAYDLATSACGLKVGVVGLGRVGMEIAKRLTVLKSSVAYFSRHKKDVPYPYYDNLLALAREADCLIIILSASDETYHIVNAEVLEALGPEGYIINVARGSIIDTRALIDALRNHKIKGAGLDVFEHEPNVEKELLELDNVVLSPHAGSATNHSRTLMANLVLENIDSYMKTGQLVTPVVL